MLVAITRVAMLVTLMSLSSCQKQTGKSMAVRNGAVLSDQQIRSLSAKRIFFGHQSVGDNIVQGIRDLMAADARLKINMASSAEPQSVPGFAIVEAHIGV